MLSGIRILRRFVESLRIPTILLEYRQTSKGEKQYYEKNQTLDRLDEHHGLPVGFFDSGHQLCNEL